MAEGNSAVTGGESGVGGAVCAGSVLFDECAIAAAGGGAEEFVSGLVGRWHRNADRSRQPAIKHTASYGTEGWSMPSPVFLRSFTIYGGSQIKIERFPGMRQGGLQYRPLRPNLHPAKTC